MSSFVAHKLSRIRWSRMEVTDAADRDATGDSQKYRKYSRNIGTKYRDTKI